MKLKSFTHQTAYRFILTFENGKTQEADLEELVGQYVNTTELATAQINVEWGCLEFKAGMVDIEPTTLYKYVTGNVFTQPMLQPA